MRCFKALEGCTIFFFGLTKLEWAAPDIAKLVTSLGPLGIDDIDAL